MRTEKQLLQLAEARKHIKHNPLSEKTKLKIGQANNDNFFATCDYCGKEYHTKKSAYNKRKHHFCSRECYSKYRSEIMPKEEQNAYGTGFSQEERNKRIKARSILNHYIRNNNITRPCCEICGAENAQAHHDDYNKPLDVKWLCFNCHSEYHKNHPELLKEPK